MTTLDGPRLAPASRRPARGLVVLLHGYGADGNDLIGIGRQWGRAVPDLAFASPHAPETLPGAGRQWFALTFRDPSEYWRGTSAAGPALDAFIDAECARLGLGPDRVVLAGFSQGAMMALHVGLRRRQAPAAVIAYSGLLAGPEHLAASTARPAITLVHGTDDPVIPAAATLAAASALGAAGIPATWHLSPRLAHGIDERGLAIGLDTVVQALGLR